MLTNSDIKVRNIIASGIKYNESTSIVGKVLEIGNSDREFEQIYIECEESFSWLFKDNYCGIPLTDDWHDKLGGIKNGFGEYTYNISRYDKPELFLVFSGDYLYIREYELKNGKLLPTDLICLWNKDIKKEFYVHEFQNLYRSITEKEINVEY